MAFKARYLYGNPQMVDHTPGAAIAAGDVVTVGNELRIAHNDIAAGSLGALAAGGGVYEIVTDEALNDGEVSYWDAGTELATATAGSNLVLGRNVADNAASDGVATILHDPSANGS